MVCTTVTRFTIIGVNFLNTFSYRFYSANRYLTLPLTLFSFTFCRFHRVNVCIRVIIGLRFSRIKSRLISTLSVKARLWEAGFSFDLELRCQLLCVRYSNYGGSITGIKVFMFTRGLLSDTHCVLLRYTLVDTSLNYILTICR